MRVALEPNPPLWCACILWLVVVGRKHAPACHHTPACVLAGLNVHMLLMSVVLVPSLLVRRVHLDMAECVALALLDAAWPV